MLQTTRPSTMRARASPVLRSTGNGFSSHSIPTPALPRHAPSVWRNRSGHICHAKPVDLPTPAGYERAEGLRIERISFGSILTPVGLGLLVYGFGAFFQMLPGGDVSSLLLIYGFPISLLGFALSYAQLRPVPCFSQPAALKLRELQATDIQNQLRDDVTRFRYGDEQHLDEALSRIFRFGQAGGLPRRFCPVLVAVREEVREDAYTLVLDFETKEGMEEEEWVGRVEKIQSFFGPGIRVELKAREGGEEVALVCDGSGAGRGGEKQGDALPPLMPGLPARQQK